jgi:hypothetical protein
MFLASSYDFVIGKDKLQSRQAIEKNRSSQKAGTREF